jgi:AmmeMemoRadiSam system protein A
MQLSEENRQVLLDVAREAIRRALRGDVPPTLPSNAELEQPAGCFVSLHELRSHRLRGCVGRLDAKAPLAATVLTMARAVLEDPRFLNMPVAWDDLPNIQIELSILSPLQPTAGPLEFDLLNDGIYLSHGEQSGCFLPQVARETGWSKEQLLDRLCTEKLGLSSFSWRHPKAKLYRFTTLLVGPEPFEKRA